MCAASRETQERTDWLPISAQEHGSEQGKNGRHAVLSPSEFLTERQIAWNTSKARGRDMPRSDEMYGSYLLRTTGSMTPAGCKADYWVEDVTDTYGKTIPFVFVRLSWVQDGAANEYVSTFAFAEGRSYLSRDIAWFELGRRLHKAKNYAAEGYAKSFAEVLK